MQSLNEISWNQFHEKTRQIWSILLLGTFHQTQTLKLGWVVCLHFFHGSAVWEAMIVINLDDGSFKKKSLKLFKIFIRNFREKNTDSLVNRDLSASTKKLSSYLQCYEKSSLQVTNKWKNSKEILKCSNFFLIFFPIFDFFGF